MHISHTQRHSNFALLYILNKGLFSGQIPAHKTFWNLACAPWKSHLHTLSEIITFSDGEKTLRGFTQFDLEHEGVAGSAAELRAVCTKPSGWKGLYYQIPSPEKVHFLTQDIPLVKNPGLNVMFCIP